MEKYGSLDIYEEDVKKIFIIDHEELQFNNNYVWNLIWITDEPNGLVSDHECYCIHKYVFDIIQSNHQDKNISLKILSNEPNENDSQCNETYICYNKIRKKKQILVIIHPVVIFR